MLGYMLATLAEGTGAEWSIRTAGTHVVEGSAMSSRTRDALLKIDALGQPRYGAHRSHQFNAEDAAWADVILASEAGHVHYVRTHFVGAGNKTVQLVRFVESAPPNVDVNDQLRVVASLEPSPSLDVLDPAGGDEAVYDACASQLWELAKAFALLVGEDPRS